MTKALAAVAGFVMGAMLIHIYHLQQTNSTLAPRDVAVGTLSEEDVIGSQVNVRFPFLSVKAGTSVAKFEEWNGKRLARRDAAMAECKTPGVAVRPSGGWCLSPTTTKMGKIFLAHNHVLADPGLAPALATVLRGKSVLDIGAGVGQFGYYFETNNVAFTSYDAFDGAGNVEEFTQGAVNFLDLTHTDALEVLQVDWVLCLEVGEHVPKPYEDVLIDNLDKANRLGMILSWGRPGQGGHSHINEQPNDYVIASVTRRGYTYDEALSKTLRTGSEYYWFKGTIMVFRKN